MSSVILNGDTSGSITLTVPSVAGTNTLTLPALTGTIITSASTSGVPNTINWTTVQTSSVNPAVAFTGYPMNTTSGALTVTLPASPTAGQMISILDYAGTAATNNITVNPNGNKIQGSTSNATISTNREAINLVYVDSTQGWLAYSDVYSTTAPLPQVYTASYLVVAGGGGGGGATGGGGGAGGYLTGTVTLTAGSVYTATVGGGGAVNGAGSNSVLSGSGISTQTASGGGLGGNRTSTGPGGNGGSGGGGGGGGPSNLPSGSGTPGQGNNGGNGYTSPAIDAGGGGGGASAVGTAGSGGSGGSGGNGTANSIVGTPTTYAGGGGGGYQPGASSPGGTGGGGASGNASGTAGTANTGGGGGGSLTSPGGSLGGSGVVILSVPTANYSGTTTGSPTITTSGSNTIIKFTATGTYTA